MSNNFNILKKSIKTLQENHQIENNLKDKI